MSQHTAQQARGIRKEKSIATKEFPVVTETAKDSKKSCRDRENSVTEELIGKKRKCMLQEGKECHDRFQKDKDMIS